MRRKITTGGELFRRNPKGRLGSAMVKAEEIMDKSRMMQVVVFFGGAARLLDIRTCGRTGATATDVSTGKTGRIPVRLVWALERVAK